MQETLSLLNNVLFYSVVLFALCSFAGIVISLKSKEYKVFKKRLSLLNPTYYLFFSITVFSFIMISVLKRHFTQVNALFAIFLAIILFSGIKLYRVYKNRLAFEMSKNFAGKKYFCDILICAALYFFVISDII
jgi:hypothetical protein